MNKVVKICDFLIEFSFYFLFIIVPVILTPWNYELFEYNKMMVVYGITIIIAASWLIKMAALRNFIIKRTPFDIPILLFLISQFLSTLFSMDLHTSIWGYYSRFHGGLLSTIAYTVLYFALVNNLRDIKIIKNIIIIILGTGFLVSFYGILEHFGIDKNLWVQDVQNRVFSTLGQPNWLAAYLAVLLPISIIPILPINTNTTNKYQLIVYMAISAVFYATLLFTKSRSGIIGFWIADAILLTSVIANEVKQSRPKILNPLRLPRSLCSLAMTFVFLVMSFFIGGAGLGSRFAPAPSTSSGESILSVGITESGDIRKIVWQGAFEIFKHNPVFGTGVETFAYSYYKFRPAAHNMTSEWDFLYNKAHNEYLNFLATTGIVGFASYMAFILSFIVWNYKQLCHREPSQTWRGDLKKIPACRQAGLLYDRNDIIQIALFASWVSILVTNFFGFSVVIIGLFFFLIPAMSFKLATEKQPLPKNQPISNPIKVIIVIIVIIVIMLEYNLWNLWQADTFFAKGYRQNRAMQFSSSYDNLSEAIKLNPNEPFYADELAYSSSILALILTSQKNATDSAQKLYYQAAALSNKVISENPQNINFYKSRVRTYYALSQVNPKYKTEILNTLYKAEMLAPTDPKISYNLAVVLGQSGQQAEAEKYFKKTIALKPDYRDAYYGLGLLYKDMDKTEEAKAELNFILKNLNPKDEEVKMKLEEWN